VLRTARVKNEGKDGEALGDSPGGATGPAQLWECVDLIVGRDNLDCRPENTLGWPGRPKEGCPVKGTGDPGDYIKAEAGTQAGGTERSRVLNSSRQGSVSHQCVSIFIDYCTAPRDTQKGGRRRKRHSTRTRV
jgi:hypothetical protein